MGLSGFLLSSALGAYIVLPAVGQSSPVLLFGPTAARGDIAEETLSLLTASDASDGLSQWKEVRADMQRSGGALHLRTGVVKAMSNEQQRLLATRSVEHGIALSLEIGGAMCKGDRGGGWGQGEQNMEHYKAFIESGGQFKFIGLESVFSRTSKAIRQNDCLEQSLAVTANETAFFAKSMANRWPDAQFFLYDALPHFHVGEFPANNKNYDMELIDVVQKLHDAMKAQGLTLSGYWMDCPYEVSTNLEGFDGFEKIAEAVRQIKGLQLQVGKTFNSGDGGKASNAEFYTQTMADFHRTIAKVPISSFDFAMVETWFQFPDSILPETKPWTTAYTTRQVFREMLNEYVQV